MTSVRLLPNATDLVVLVDGAGRTLGTAHRLAVHTDNTPRHLAFSSYLFDPDGRLLITRRALDKITWAGVWTNSCCGHLRPGENALQAAARRISEELGVHPTDLRVVLPDFSYRAVDASGIVENELCPVLVGQIPARVNPDPTEISEYTFVTWEDFQTAIAATPAVYSPWAVAQMAQLAGRHPLQPTPASDLTGFRADVDAEMATQFKILQTKWSQFATHASLDILPDDLPGWAQRACAQGGKRIRVAMVWYGFLAGGGRTRPAGYCDAVRAAAAIELLHLFALIHDDVMDASPLRRGVPAAHVEAAEWHAAAGGAGDSEQFGRSMAMLLGDLLHSQADQLAARLPVVMRDRWFELCIELIAGQRADLTGSAARRRDLDVAEQIADRKSGAYTTTRPLLLGAAAAQAGRDAESVLAEFGHCLGLAFALRDDALGAWGDPTVTGKPAGDDLTAGKPTAIVALARQRLDEGALGLLDAVSTGKATAEEVARLQQVLVDTGVQAEVESMIQAQAQGALNLLKRGGLDAEGVEGLRQAVAALAWRRA